MIKTVDLGLQYGGRTLFNHADLVFSPGNCYGIIGANGAGKSTFLKILSGELEADRGEVIRDPKERISVLKQDHFMYDGYTVIDTVLHGNEELCDIMQKKEELYSKQSMTEEEGMLLCELEDRFSEMNGWSAESDAEILLNSLGITTEYHTALMNTLSGDMKVKVLLAQALFGSPDILLMDEPTNHLDLETTDWLEEFLMSLENSTVIVVSHDRHFLNKVCTHIVDVDFGKITTVVGNYDFWYEYTQIRQRQIREQNKKAEQKIKELQDFIARFSANASKSKQATSRKKLLDNITLEDEGVSSRRFPFIDFKPDRSIGKDVLSVEGLCKSVGGKKILDNVTFTVHPHDKIAFIGDDPVARTMLFRIICGEEQPDAGSIKWGVTTSVSSFPSDNSEFFDGCEDNLVEWVRRYSSLVYESDVRSWLGRLLFSGDEVYKKASVLSGGEKVRMMLCKMMLSGANVLVLDEPTNHLDLESIAALNDGLIRFPEVLLFTSHDHQFVQTVSNRIIDVTAGRFNDMQITYDEYIERKKKGDI